MKKCCRTCANIPCTRKECDIENKNACEYYKSLVQAVSEKEPYSIVEEEGGIKIIRRID